MTSQVEDNKIEVYNVDTESIEELPVDHDEELKSGIVVGNWRYITGKNYDSIPPEDLYRSVMKFSFKHDKMYIYYRLLKNIEMNKYKMSEGDYTDEERKEAMKSAVINIIKFKEFTHRCSIHELNDFWKSYFEIDKSFNVQRKIKSSFDIPECFKNDKSSKSKNASKPKKNH